jgi:FolB domain-containing protein
MDQILIQNLRLRCLIGFSEHELRDKQDVVINMTIFTDFRKGGASDNPDDLAVNYRKVNKAVIQHVEASSYKTLEALATNIARVAILEGGAERLRVEVFKPGALRFTDNVGIVLERSRKDFA